MEKDINRQYIKISGKMEIRDSMEIGGDAVVALKGSIVKTETNDNQDGSVDITYVLKAVEVQVDISPNVEQ